MRVHVVKALTLPDAYTIARRAKQRLKGLKAAAMLKRLVQDT